MVISIKISNLIWWSLSSLATVVFCIIVTSFIVKDLYGVTYMHRLLIGFFVSGWFFNALEDLRKIFST